MKASTAQEFLIFKNIQCRSIFCFHTFLNKGSLMSFFIEETLNLCLELWRFAFVWYNMQCRRCKRVKAMVFNATFNNISLLLLEETGAPGENQ
jgi:hypothetical protein